MLLDVAGSPGRSQRHSGDCPVGAGTRGGVVTVEDAKGNSEGRRNVSRQLLLSNVSTSVTPTLPNWSDLPGHRRQGSLVIQRRSQEEQKMDGRADRQVQSPFLGVCDSSQV